MTRLVWDRTVQLCSMGSHTLRLGFFSLLFLSLSPFFSFVFLDWASLQGYDRIPKKKVETYRYFSILRSRKSHSQAQDQSEK